MPLFEGAKPIANSRSNARLSVSQVFSPAERWIHDPTLPRLFEYSYGGPGHVVLTKGTIVAFGDAPVEDYETGKQVYPITYANGANNPIGVLPYNVYQKVNDRLLGNQPSILTHEYIELPLMVGAENVYNINVAGAGNTAAVKALVDAISLDANLSVNMKMKWGCFYAHDAAEYALLKPGDYLKSDKFGKFVRWTPENTTYSVSVSVATSDTFNTLNTAETFSSGNTEEFTTEAGTLIYTLTKAGANGANVGSVTAVTLDGAPLETPAGYSYAAGAINLSADPGDGKVLSVTYSQKVFTVAAADVLAIKSVAVGDNTLAPAGYAVNGKQVTLSADPGPSTTITIASYKSNYVISKTGAYDVKVFVGDTEFADATYTSGTRTVTLSAAPGADSITVKYNTFEALVANVTGVTTGDKESQIIGQVLAIESGANPLGWLKWVTPVVETGERAMDDNKLDAPDATSGYPADPNYRFPLTGDYTSPGPWKDYNGIPGLTDGAVSQLGAGVLPGWDFAGSVGAIRIALRY